MENLDRLTVPKSVLINQPKMLMPQNLSAQIVCPSPAIWDFSSNCLPKPSNLRFQWKKPSLCVRSPCLESIHKSFFSLSQPTSSFETILIKKVKYYSFKTSTRWNFENWRKQNNSSIPIIKLKPRAFYSAIVYIAGRIHVMFDDMNQSIRFFSGKKILYWFMFILNITNLQRVKVDYFMFHFMSFYDYESGCFDFSQNICLQT